jgi:hypothetical protein
MKIRHAKARSEWVELRFMTRATELSLRVIKPWGDNAPYDFAIDCPDRASGRRDCLGHFARVQVKCTLCKRDNSYVCTMCSNHIAYRPDQIDFIAAYVIPTDTWYILPIAAIHGQLEIVLSPHRKNSKYAQYKEAWHLLMR